MSIKKMAVFHNLPSGGAKRALYGFIKYLTKCDHHVDVFVPSTANEEFLPLKEVAHTVKTFPVRKTIRGSVYSSFYYIPPIKEKISLRDLENVEKEVATEVNEGGYDVVLCEQDQFTMSPFLLRYVRRPTVYYCQQPLRRSEAILKVLSQMGSSGNISPVKKLWRKCFGGRLPRIDMENASYAKYIVTNSYFSRESILRSYGLNSFVSYLGVDTELFGPLGIQRDDFVLSVGRCVPAKGFDFIIRALARIDPSSRPPLVIVSDNYIPGWKSHLTDLAAEAGVDLEIKTLISNDELVRLYNRARLVVYAPYLEPFGFVPLEAMACGTPVVAVKEGGVRESVLCCETGILTERDEEAFALAVTKLLGDRWRREKMSKNCIESIQKFWTLDHAGERLLNHLNRAVALWRK